MFFSDTVSSQHTSSLDAPAADPWLDQQGFTRSVSIQGKNILLRARGLSLPHSLLGCLSVLSAMRRVNAVLHEVNGVLLMKGTPSRLLTEVPRQQRHTMGAGEGTHLHMETWPTDSAWRPAVPQGGQWARKLQLPPGAAADTAGTRPADRTGHAELVRTPQLECNAIRASASASTCVLKIGNICSSKSSQIGHPDGPNMGNQA